MLLKFRGAQPPPAAIWCALAPNVFNPSDSAHQSTSCRRRGRLRQHPRRVRSPNPQNKIIDDKIVFLALGRLDARGLLKAGHRTEQQACACGDAVTRREKSEEEITTEVTEAEGGHGEGREELRNTRRRRGYGGQARKREKEGPAAAWQVARDLPAFFLRMRTSAA